MKSLFANLRNFFSNMAPATPDEPSVHDSFEHDVPTVSRGESAREDGGDQRTRRSSHSSNETVAVAAATTTMGGCDGGGAAGGGCGGM